MKRIFITLLVITMVLASFSACQSTPKKPVVVQKDTEQMIEAVQSDTGKKTFSEMVSAPDRMKLSVQNGNGSVSVNVDAEIVIPDTESIATLRVKKHSFSQVDADKVLQYFIGGGAFDSSYTGENDAYIDMLLQMKAELAKETDPAKKAQLQASIEKLESTGIQASGGQQEIAPASRMFVESKPGYQQIEGYSESREGKIFLSIVNDPDMNEYRVLYTQEQDGFATDVGTYWDEAKKSNMSKIGLDTDTVSRMPLSLTEEQAQKTASQALEAMGISDMVLAYCGEVWGGTGIGNGVMQAQHAYQLEYVREISGVPVTYSELGIASGSQIETNDGGYAALWPYERVHFIIDDKGITEFIWESPYELSDTVAESSALKSFDEIQNVFTNMMPITNTYASGEGIKITFDITRVQLGYMRITEKNSTDTALFIPVWDFFGTYTTTDGEATSSDKSVYASRLTINAIDGSIIDRNLGY